MLITNVETHTGPGGITEITLRGILRGDDARYVFDLSNSVVSIVTLIHLNKVLVEHQVSSEQLISYIAALQVANTLAERVVEI